MVLGSKSSAASTPSAGIGVTCEVIESVESARQKSKVYEKTSLHLVQGQSPSPIRFDGRLVKNVMVTLLVGQGTIGELPTLQVSGTVLDRLTGAESHSTSMIAMGAKDAASTMLAIYSRQNQDAVAISCTPDTYTR